LHNVRKKLFIRVSKELYSENSMDIVLTDFLIASGNKVFDNDKYAFYEFSHYFEELLKGNNLRILTEAIYGMKVPKSCIIKDAEKEYIYIVNGNVIKKVEVEVKELDEDLATLRVVDEELSSFESFIIVLTPKLFRVGEVVGNF